MKRREFLRTTGIGMAGGLFWKKVVSVIDSITKKPATNMLSSELVVSGINLKTKEIVRYMFFRRKTASGKIEYCGGEVNKRTKTMSKSMGYEQIDFGTYFDYMYPDLRGWVDGVLVPDNFSVNRQSLYLDGLLKYKDFSEQARKPGSDFSPSKLVPLPKT